ncbi:Thioredoxin [Rhynchospora pubera]|uniref:Thioredoxin n=1 Tax=Rhynchospora pubera TaxID=906938 RepID=A0AAV8EV86_9POAL|nr:Thioredoxin [Rhynchospora pubera]
MASSTLVRTLVAPQPRASAGKPASATVCSLHGGRNGVSLSSGFSGSSLYRNQRKAGLSMSVVKSRSPRRGSLVCRAQDTALDVPDVTSSTWQEQVLESDTAVLVEFWAPWCGPCRMMHPVIGKLSKSYEGKLKCFKVNTDENQEVASKYGIRSIPTVIMFKNGEKKDAVIGAVPESTLVSLIEKFVGA